MYIYIGAIYINFELNWAYLQPFNGALQGDICHSAAL